MRRLFAVALATALVAFIGLFTTACGGSGDGPTGVITPPPPPPPVVTLSSIGVSGDTALVVGMTKQYSAVAKYSDGNTKDITALASWGSIPSMIVSVMAGNVTALKSGNVQLSVTYGGMNNAIKVVVNPDPMVSTYNQLLPAVKVMVGGFMASNRALWRQDISQPIKLWADSRFPSQNLVLAMEYWKNRVPGIRFALVSDSISASVKVVYDSTIGTNNPEACGWGGGAGVVNDMLTTGRVWIRPDLPGCSGWMVLAHELGHVLGEMIHTPSGTDIMAAVGRTDFQPDNPDQTAAFVFVYTAPGGWKIPLP